MLFVNCLYKPWNCRPVPAPIAHSDISGNSSAVIFINVLNEVGRLNDWNDWNKRSWVSVSQMPDVTG